MAGAILFVRLAGATELLQGLEEVMQEKRFEPEWLADISVGEVRVQAGYYLKQLSMGEYEKPIIGMVSCFDYFSKGGAREGNWSARE